MNHTLRFTVCAQHPSLAGHFPGEPILPGVVLLDEVLHAVEAAGGGGRWRIGNAKFLMPARPGDTLVLEHEESTRGEFRFRISRDGQAVAHGVLHAIADGAPQREADGAD